MSKKKSFFTARLVLEVLGGNWREMLTLEEISKEVDKRVGKETTVITTNDATELKRILDDLRQDKYVNIFDLDDGTKTKYQIHHKILKARFDSNDGKFHHYIDPLKMERFESPQERRAREDQEKRAYYSSQNYLSREEYKKNKKYINKKEWEQYVVNGGIHSYSRKSYSPRARLERKRSRREWLTILICMLIPIIVSAIFFLVL